MKPNTPTKNKEGYGREFVVAALALAVFFEMFVLTDGFLFIRQSNNLASVLPGVVASLTNTARTDAQLQTLTPNETLAKGAQLKADDMAQYGYFSHTGLDGSPPWKWFQAVGYKYEYAGENLGVNFSESEEVVDAWLKSPTHRANIMKAQFSEIGVGTATGTYKGRETTFVVQFFGKPAPQGMAAVATGRGAGNVRPDELLVSGEVLGTSTESVIERFVAAPMTLSKQAVFALAGLLVLILLGGLFFGRRLPKLSIAIGALIVLVLLLGLVMVNKQYFLGETGAENASEEVR